MAITARRFDAVVRIDATVADGYMKHYVALPDDLAATFAAAGVERVEGTIGGTRFRRRLQDRADGGLSLRFGVSWLRDAGLTPGDVVTVEVAEETDPDRVDVPDELAAVFDVDPAVEHVWGALTPGRQRTLVYGIERAKRPETRTRRAAALARQLRDEYGLDASGPT